MNEKPIKNFIIIISILLSFSLIYIVLDKIFNTEKSEDDVYLKNYEVNEYIPVYISDEAMAKIYLNDFTRKIYYNIENAYNLLDTEYKVQKFGSLEGFKNYISSVIISSQMSRYSKKGNLFMVYDINENFYIFETNGVMQYKVYLDDYTVED